MKTIGKRMEALLLQKNGGNQSEMARFVGVSPQAVQKWIADLSQPRGKNLTMAAEFLHVSPANLQFGEPKDNPSRLQNDSVTSKFQPDFQLINADDSNHETGAIEYWNVRGSCGGGFLNDEQIPKGHLIKEATFFAKYSVKPENTFAIYADGDSMAEFIVDGDIVIFDKSKTTPISGQIFAIEHPDGLRIKVIRRSIDGSWTLESKNQDKRSFPDEVIPAGHTDLLKIHGQFVYRQGG